MKKSVWLLSLLLLSLSLVACNKENVSKAQAATAPVDPVDQAMYVTVRPSGFTSEQCGQEFEKAAAQLCGPTPNKETSRADVYDAWSECRSGIIDRLQDRRWEHRGYFKDAPAHTCVAIVKECPNTGYHWTCVEGTCAGGCSGVGGKDE